MKHIFLVAALCLSFSSVVQAQGELPRRSCSKCVITRTFNPSINGTVVLLKQMPVIEMGDRGTMYFSLSSTENPKLPSRRAISVAITFISKEIVKVANSELRAQLDEGTLNLGSLAYSSVASSTNFKISNYRGYVPWDDIVSLSQSKEVEMSFDAAKFTLTREHKAAIADFLAYATQQ